MKTVILEIRKFDDVLDDVAIACRHGNSTSPRISFETVESLWKTISPEKMEILQSMAGAGALGVREIARRVARDVRAVHRDLQALIMAGIAQKTADGKQLFPYDEIHVDFTLSAELLEHWIVDLEDYFRNALLMQSSEAHSPSL